MYRKAWAVATRSHPVPPPQLQCRPLCGMRAHERRRRRACNADAAAAARPVECEAIRAAAAASSPRWMVAMTAAEVASALLGEARAGGGGAAAVASAPAAASGLLAQPTLCRARLSKPPVWLIAASLELAAVPRARPKPRPQLLRATPRRLDARSAGVLPENGSEDVGRGALWGELQPWHRRCATLADAAARARAHTGESLQKKGGLKNGPSPKGG